MVRLTNNVLSTAQQVYLRQLGGAQPIVDKEGSGIISAGQAKRTPLPPPSATATATDAPTSTSTKDSRGTRLIIYYAYLGLLTPWYYFSTSWFICVINLCQHFANRFKQLKEEEARKKEARRKAAEEASKAAAAKAAEERDNILRAQLAQEAQKSAASAGETSDEAQVESDGEKEDSDNSKVLTLTLLFGSWYQFESVDMTNHCSPHIL